MSTDETPRNWPQDYPAESYGYHEWSYVGPLPLNVANVLMYAALNEMGH